MGEEVIDHKIGTRIDIMNKAGKQKEVCSRRGRWLGGLEGPEAEWQLQIVPLLARFFADFASPPVHPILSDLSSASPTRNLGLRLSSLFEVIFMAALLTASVVACGTSSSSLLSAFVLQ